MLLIAKNPGRIVNTLQRRNDKDDPHVVAFTLCATTENRSPTGDTGHENPLLLFGDALAAAGTVTAATAP